MKWFIAALLTVMLAGAGCSKKSDDAKAGEPTTGEPTAVGPELTDQDLPVATDFADEAESQITAENYKSEIDKLEQEIAAE